MTTGPVALLVAAAAVAVLPVPADLPRRTRRVRRGRAGLSTRQRRAVVLGGGLGSAVVLLMPAAPEVAVAVAVVGAAVGWWLPDRPSAAIRDRQRADLGLVLELWAAGLAGGLPTGTALDSALDASGSKPSAQLAVLARTAALLRLGADADRAWAGVDADRELAPIAGAARRSALSGAELGAMVREQATVLRRTALAEMVRRSARGAVLMTAPLGLCFLPAFICLGLAPVVLALLDTLTIGR